MAIFIHESQTQLEGEVLVDLLPTEHTGEFEDGLAVQGVVVGVHVDGLGQLAQGHDDAAPDAVGHRLVLLVDGRGEALEALVADDVEDVGARVGVEVELRDGLMADLWCLMLKWHWL